MVLPLVNTACRQPSPVNECPVCASADLYMLMLYVVCASCSYSRTEKVVTFHVFFGESVSETASESASESASKWGLVFVPLDLLFFLFFPLFFFHLCFVFSDRFAFLLLSTGNENYQAALGRVSYARRKECVLCVKTNKHIMPLGRNPAKKKALSPVVERSVPYTHD